MKKLFAWLDKNLLLVWALFLLGFVPLYPKLPLLDILPGYIVRLRLEDILIFIGFLLVLREVFRQKKKLGQTPLLKPILVYLAVGLLSSLSAIFVTHTVPAEPLHVAKLFLHYLRRIEYFSIFFIFYFGFLKLPTRFKKLSFVPLLLILIAVAVYGFGQKYLYWPVYSTMNREFSKGMRLYLTEHARVPSTFGGHYDLAAFLVISLPLALSLFYSLKNRWLRLLALLSFALGFWLLILTASRTSFIAYLFSLMVLFAVLGWRKGFRWGATRAFGWVFLSILIMINFGDLSSRYVHFLKLSHWTEKYDLSRLLEPFKKEPPPSGIAVGDVTDQPPVATKPAKPLPPDVYVDVPEKIVTYSAKTKEASPTPVVVYKPRTYSETAYKYGLSVAIRLDALWPRAWQRCKLNPLLGAGYSTLTKEKLSDFTEAESTDNDYLRMLGETGILGFLSFLAIVGSVLAAAWRLFKTTQDRYFQFIAAAVVAFTLGLLVNALYIDVFEASKVAFGFWAVTGIFFATVPQLARSTKRKR